MAVRRYTRDELNRLRESPLVQKPEDLPAIEQWLEYVYVYTDKDSREKLRIPHSESAQAQHPTARRQAGSKTPGGDGASPMGSFSTSVRPSLMPRRDTGRNGGEYLTTKLVNPLLSRGLMRGEDEVSLGPPRTTFPSSRNTAKLSDFDKTATPTTGEGGTAEEPDAPRSRFFPGERPSRKSMGEKEGRDHRESWTSARERRQLGGEEEEGRFGRREKDKDKDKDKDQDGERRNGFGDKHDGRWGERRQNGDRQGGWREREREKRDRVWDRNGPQEKEPEWMDEPAPNENEDDLRTMGMPRNQEQFQKWKEAMSGKKAVNEEAENAEPEPAPPPKDTTKIAAPLKLEGIVDKPFGGWGAAKVSEPAPTPAKAAPGLSKTSRFASMFKDTQPKDETPPIETNVPKPTTGLNGSAEDAAGFQRILQMLGDTNVGQPSPPDPQPLASPPRKATNGTQPKSRFTGFFDQAAKSPDRMQSPPQDAFNLPSNAEMFQTNRGISEMGIFGGRLPEQPMGDQSARSHIHSNPMSPEPMQSTNGNHDQHQQQGRPNDIFLDDPPSRGAATPDVNIQNLLASQQRAQRAQGQDKNQEFLLNLLQAKASRPQSQQQRPDNNFDLWLQQPPSMPEPHAPKPRAPPHPGLFEEQLLRNTPQDMPRQDQPMPGNEMPQRRTSQRAPPGFFDEHSIFLRQQQQQQQAQQQAQQQQHISQRRNYTEPPQQHEYPQPGRRMSGHPQMPQMQMPPHQQYPGPPPEYLQSPGGQAPPPGFPPQMRHAPGFQNIPNIFQQQQPQQQIPGFPNAGMPGGGMGSPPNAPPGFFPQGMPPPGFPQGLQQGLPMRGGGRGFDGGYDAGARR